jgi:rubredoxin
MICGFCGHEFDEKDGKMGCGNCGGGCRGIHCPRCNYKNPAEPNFIKKIRAKINKTDRNNGGK